MSSNHPRGLRASLGTGSPGITDLAATHALRNGFCEFFFKGAAWYGAPAGSGPKTLYLAAFTEVDQKATVPPIEASGPGYARIVLPANSTSWSRVVCGRVTNLVDLLVPGTNLGTISGIGLYDAPTNGNLLFIWKAPPFTVGAVPYPHPVSVFAP